MSEESGTQGSGTPAAEGQAEPQVGSVVVQKRRWFSVVWLIPLVAAGIGAWLVYQTIIQKGPTVTITFKTADGLEAGKTKVKYKAVEVGEVDRIDLTKDLSRVVVTASFVPGSGKYLTEDTQFWVVRPRITLGGISGLGTLLSGAYIGVKPGTGKIARSFVGLEQPPILETDTPGTKFVLEAENLGSIGIGAPIYFRDVRVGEVVGYELAEDDQSVTIHAFVNAPHHKLVYENTRFWNASGIDISMGADGVNIRAESLVALAAGGIAFDTPGKTGKPVKSGEVFRLYKSFAAIGEVSDEGGVPYLVYFKGSVRGLKIEAPVEFRGIKIGKVTDVQLKVDSDDTELTIPVTIEIDRNRLIGTRGSRAEVRKLMQALVERGLRAKLETGSLLTGSLFVGMDLHPDAPVKLLGSSDGQYPELPTIPSELSEIEEGASEIVAKLRKLPIEDLFKEIQTAVRDVDQLIKNVDGELKPLSANLTRAAKTARNTMVKAEKTLANLEGITADDSPTRYDLDNLLRELSTAARSIRVLASYLERNPDALIYGKGGRQR